MQRQGRRQKITTCARLSAPFHYSTSTATVFRLKYNLQHSYAGQHSSCHTERNALQQDQRSCLVQRLVLTTPTTQTVNFCRFTGCLQRWCLNVSRQGECPLVRPATSSSFLTLNFRCSATPPLLFQLSPVSSYQRWTFLDVVVIGNVVPVPVVRYRLRSPNNLTELTNTPTIHWSS